MIEICPKCNYPISKTVQLLMAAGVKARPHPNTFICECGITDSERERLGHGDPTNLIELMEEKGFNDWWYMIYKLTHGPIVDLLHTEHYEPVDRQAGGGYDK